MVTDIDPGRATRLYSLARELSRALTAPDVVAAVFAGVSQLGASSTGLWLLSGDALHFVSGAGAARYELAANLSSLALDADLPGPEAVRRCRTVTYASAAERNARWPALRGLHTGSQGTAVLPLQASGRVLGCLHIAFPSETGADQLDLPYLEGLAELCAAALDRALLHDAERDRQALLLEASVAVSGADSFAESLRRLAEVAASRLADMCLIDVWEEGRQIRRMAAVHRDPAVAPLVDELAERYPPAVGGEHPAFRAMAEGRSRWLGHVDEEFLRATTRDERHLDLVRRLGLRSFISVPLMGAGEVLGAITLVLTGAERSFGPADVLLAEQLAGQVAGVIGAARRLDRQHEVAHSLQSLLLPAHLPDLPGIEVCARYQAARRDAEVGGDFYDLVGLPSGRVGFAIGDVEGHDPMAAAVMGQLRSALRALAGQLREPGLLLDGLRWSWDLLGFERMATCLVGRLDPTDGSLVVASAGHLPPVLIRPDGRLGLLPVGCSPPFGLEAPPAVEHSVRVAPGSTLFLYTDGLVERPGLAIEDGIESLLEVLSGAGSACGPLDELCEKALANRPAETEPSDDIALLALRWTGDCPPG
jgi:serine phosphatase RsbU (regulator of sigma subunit)